ncbi:VrrA/YqfQ family protein [Virgibacillus sp. W0181]|uniref:VrrA/YqfQ family protein n=1 Tax=Virgibacillus sp. W0181 TaxID=3391581 RepID=UPI003F486FA5
MTNVQQVLQVVQSAAPIVQQYGPMVKNIPMMYHMFKAFKEMDNDTEDEEEQLADDDLNEAEPLEDIMESTTSSEDLEYKDGKSKPKLFI